MVVLQNRKTNFPLGFSYNVTFFPLEIISAKGKGDKSCCFQPGEDFGMGFGQG